ncbi:MAG: S8 family serine peptidase [Planctomycetes bacterium]|nr:S8 family serine peptidase [Planctomycetota bacterium]
MKNLNLIKSMLGAIALAALVPMSLEAQARPTFIGNPNLVRPDDAQHSAALDRALGDIAALDATGDRWDHIADLRGVTVLDGLVLAEIHADRPAGADMDEGALREVINSALSDVKVLPGSTTDMCRVWIAPGLLPVLEEALSMRFANVAVSPCRAPVANAYGLVATEGEEAIRSGLYNLTGHGVVVAVMDIGFAGMEAMPLETGNVNRRPFNNGAIDASAHGTAMIEVIRDMAPKAHILAYRIDADLDIYTATLDAINQGAKVIVSPLSWFDLPGRSLADRAAKIAIQNGTQWVNAAGNFGDGRYFEANSPQRVDMLGLEYVGFDGSDVYQFVSGVQPGEQIKLHLAQESLTDSDAQLALELYSWNGMSADMVLETAGNHQQRVQSIVHVAEAGKFYFPMVRVARDGDLRRMRMFSENGQLHFSSQAGSIACPGGMEGVLTVGAADALGYDSVERYSGQGGGIFHLTLNLCGPTNCTTGTYGPQSFSGTSAAAAHIGGLLALHVSDAALGADPVGMIVTPDIVGGAVAMARVDDAESDNDPHAATDLIAAGQVISGRSLSPDSDEDWYSFELTERMSCSIQHTDGIGKLELFQVPTDRTVIGLIEIGNGADLAALEPGHYLLRVSGGFVEQYELALELSPIPLEAVTLKSPENNTTIIGEKLEPDGLTMASLLWTPVTGNGQVTYRVRVIGEDERTDFFDFDTDAAGAEISGLVFGQTYRWQVIATDEQGGEAASDIFSFKVIPEDEEPVVDGAEDEDQGESESRSQNGRIDATGTDSSSDNEAAGCTGGASGSGVLALLLALFAAGVMRKARKA